jgi:methionine aminopeptidase
MAITKYEANRQLETVVRAQDPFSFLVLERIIKQQARARTTPMKPSQYLFGGRRRHQREQASIEQIEAICDTAWAELVGQILSLQNFTIMYNLARPLQEQMALDAHQASIKQLARDTSFYELSRPLQDLMAADALRHEISHMRAVGDEQYRQDRRTFHQEMERLDKLHGHQVEIIQATPDPDDPAYKAKRNRRAMDEYAEMLREIFESDDDEDLKHQQAKVVLSMVSDK